MAFLQVASIPRHVCLSSDAADAPVGTIRALAHALVASMLPSFNRREPPGCLEGEITFESDVVAVTLQLFLESVAGARSTFAPWMSTLNPKGKLNLPALWPADEIDPLKGTLVWREVEKCLARADIERDVVAAAIENGLREKGNVRGAGCGGGAESPPEPLWADSGKMKGRPTKAEWLHARCTVQSRAYRVGPR